MGSRGRKTLEDLTVTPTVADVLEISERQRPPHELSDEEAETWTAIVASEPADCFTVATRPLLAQYCHHVVHARRIAHLIAQTASTPNFDRDGYERLLRMQERESRVMATLATKMRLTQQSTRTHRGNKRMSLARKPWE
jgi:hypothetical protein